MKTAISIDDQLFKIAEKTAKKLGVSRSKLFSAAVEEYIDHHNTQKITKKLNEVYSKDSTEFDNTINSAQLSSVDFGEW